MNTKAILQAASENLKGLTGHVFDLLTVSKPISPAAAVNLAKIISKLSPLVGNLIEFNIVEFLNDQPQYQGLGVWKRQDPDFPDAIFESSVHPTPGFEIKAWFPLATEITARFKDSQTHFAQEQTNVCLLAWLPDKLIFGKPRIIDVCIVSALSIALARDDHYHNPPDYLVLEPEDTSSRTRNLQQTNTNGYKWQGTADKFLEAVDLVESWGLSGQKYDPTPEYQHQIRELFSKYKYRLDTNFAKMDRIAHADIETFKNRVLQTVFHGMTIADWSRLLNKGADDLIRKQLEQQLDIKEEDIDELLQ